MSTNTDACRTADTLFIGPPPVVVPVEVALLVATAPEYLPPLLVKASIYSLEQAAVGWEEFVAAHPRKRGNPERRRNAKSARQLARDAERKGRRVEPHSEIVAFRAAPKVVALGLAQWDVLVRMAPTWQLQFSSLVTVVQSLRALQADESKFAVDLGPFVDWQSRDLLRLYDRALHKTLPQLARDLQREEEYIEYLAASLRERMSRRQKYAQELEEGRRVHDAIEDLWDGEPETLRDRFADLKPSFY